MTLEKIIDIYSSSVGRHLVSRRVEIQKSNTFKGIKTYKIELWDADNHELIDSVERTACITSDTKVWVVESLEESLIHKMFIKYAKPTTE